MIYAISKVTSETDFRPKGSVPGSYPIATERVADDSDGMRFLFARQYKLSGDASCWAMGIGPAQTIIGHGLYVLTICQGALLVMPT